MSDPFDAWDRIGHPRPSYCGAAAAVSVCVAWLVVAAVGGAVAATHLFDRLRRPA